MNIYGIMSPEKSLFPSTNSAFSIFCKNLAENLNIKSNGQIRRKTEWLGSVVAASLPNQQTEFNINTLRSELINLEKMTFSQAVDLFHRQRDEIESNLCEIGSAYVAEFPKQVSISHDIDDGYDYSVWKRTKKNENSQRLLPTCDCEEMDECDECSIEVLSYRTELEAVDEAISSIVGVKQPTLSELFNDVAPEAPKSVYLVTFMDKDLGMDSIQSLKVRIDDNEANIQSKIVAKLDFYLQKQGKMSYTAIILNTTLIESLDIV